MEKVRCLTRKGAYRKDKADQDKSLKGGEVRRRRGESKMFENKRCREKGRRR